MKFFLATLAIFSLSVGMACSEPASHTATTPDVIPSELPEPAPTTLANPTSIATPTPESTPILRNTPSTTLSSEDAPIPTPVPTATPTMDTSMVELNPLPTIEHEGSSRFDPCVHVPEPHKARCEDSLFLPNFDPSNIVQVARFNFSELDKFSRMSKLRSGVGHDYSFNTDEYDPSGTNCRSMKHYFLPVGAPLKNELYDTTPHSFKWMSIKFFAPGNGMIQDLGEEHQFTVESTDHPGYYFKFHHVQLSPELTSGSSVIGGQEIGTLAEEDAWGEIGVEVRIDSRKVYLLSFLQVATDEVLNLYRVRGLTDVTGVIITKEERDARPLACNRSSSAGWFEGGGRYNPDVDYMVWQYESSDNWFFFD